MDMKTAASIFSWLGGLITAIIIWANFAPLFNYGPYYWIPLIYTIIELLILIWRESAVSKGNKVGCGVFTLIFASVIGGILTLCIPDSQLYGYTHMKSSTTAFNNYKAHSQPINSTQNNSSTQTQEISEFIFVQPTIDNPITVGSEVKIIDGFYVSSVERRAEPRDTCEVISVDGNMITIDVDKGFMHFSATTSKYNLLIKTKNPNFISKEKADENDKFEQLKKYKELLDLNIITQEEFDAKKKELLDSTN